ncbi:unnamed protein product [Lampetra fluviatilis]
MKRHELRWGATVARFGRGAQRRRGTSDGAAENAGEGPSPGEAVPRQSEEFASEVRSSSRQQQQQPALRGDFDPLPQPQPHPPQPTPTLLGVKSDLAHRRDTWCTGYSAWNPNKTTAVTGKLQDYHHDQQQLFSIHCCMKVSSSPLPPLTISRRTALSSQQ